MKILNNKKNTKKVKQTYISIDTFFSSERKMALVRSRALQVFQNSLRKTSNTQVRNIHPQAHGDCKPAPMDVGDITNFVKGVSKFVVIVGGYFAFRSYNWKPSPEGRAKGLRS